MNLRRTVDQRHGGERAKEGRRVRLLDEIAHQYKYGTADDFLAAVGYGELSPHAVIMKMALVPGDEGDELKSIPLIPQVEPTSRVLVRGERGVFTTVASCCQPVPGDAIVGYTTRGKGVTIHRQSCSNVTRARMREPERLIGADWGKPREEVFPVDVVLEAMDRQGLLRDITEIFSRERINVTAANTLTRNSATRMAFTLEVSNLEALSRALTLVRDVRGVLSAMRR